LLLDAHHSANATFKRIKELITVDAIEDDDPVKDIKQFI
jgi:hypothetical protein